MESRSFLPNRVLGLIVGGVGLTLLLALDVVFLLLLPQPPLGLANFIWGFLFLASLAPIGLLAYRTYSLWQSAYRLEPDQLIVDWGARREAIPLRDIKEALPGKDLQANLKPSGIWWPGCMVGRAQSEQLGEIQFLATMPQDEQLFIVTESGTLAISPEDLPAFREALQERLEKRSEVGSRKSDEPDEEVEGEGTGSEPAQGEEREARRESLLPAFQTWEIWGDQWALGLAAVSAVAVLALFGFILFSLPSLPVSMPLHFSADGLGAADRTGAPRGLLILPVIGLLTLIVNAALGGAFYVWAKQRTAAYFLLASAALVQILVWVATLGMIARA